MRQLKSQIVVVNDNDNSICQCCGNDLSLLGNFKYTGYDINEATCRLEKCLCNRCQTEFYLKYMLIDSNGHIDPFIFNTDVNDPDDNFIGTLTEEQKTTISSHLESCSGCRSRRDNETLTDAWFASVIHKKQILPERPNV